MRKQKLSVAVSIAVLALCGTAAAAGEPPGPQGPPPKLPEGEPPPMAPPPGVSEQPLPPPMSAEPGPPGGPRFRFRPRAVPSVPMHYEPVEQGTTLLILSHETPIVRWGYYYHGWWGPRHAILRSYTPVCTTACTERFMPGVYNLALAKNGHTAASESPVVIRGPSLVRGEYVDRSGLRVGGIALAVGGIIGGTIMMVVAVHRHDVCDAQSGICYVHNDVDGPLLAGGLALAIGSGIAGSIMAWQRDEARFTVLPMRMSSLYPGEGALSKALPQGAMFRLRF